MMADKDSATGARLIAAPREHTIGLDSTQDNPRPVTAPAVSRVEFSRLAADAHARRELLAEAMIAIIFGPDGE